MLEGHCQPAVQHGGCHEVQTLRPFSFFLPFPVSTHHGPDPAGSRREQDRGSSVGHSAGRGGLGGEPGGTDGRRLLPWGELVEDPTVCLRE